MQEDKKWLILRIGLVVVFIGLIAYGIYANNRNKLNIDNYNKDSIIAADEQNGGFGDLVLGKRDAKIVVVEYGDYQCPACGTYRHKFDKLVKNHPDQVALVFRQYILPGHTDARAASATALAAAKQGKFWEMHEKIYAGLENWSGKSDQRAAVFEGYARELGLDLERYRNDLHSHDITKKINFDMALGKAHGLTATPTVIINGENVDSEIWSDEAKITKYLADKLK